MSDPVLPTSVTIKVSADSGAKEDAARSTCHVYGKEFKSTPTPKKTTSDPAELKWGEETHFELVAGASQLVQVKLFGDIVYETSGSEPRDLPFLKMEPSVRDGVYFLRAQREWEPR
ncbi:hypothetical protein [Mesorhizobium sp. M0491]|uniref:hypothetical protein n=1 Tax=Mesorhizobium sp. M0491 TaxID=2956950 RepID=UPI003337A892